ncbi:MAG: efflux RND transporter periplasmic adaptor subunit [Bryobacteraceae bacterium]|nr:efflux RND transporter periplasmic adaptor subunit [Bryobacteraceae bacterium]
MKLNLLWRTVGMAATGVAALTQIACSPAETPMQASSVKTQGPEAVVPVVRVERAAIASTTVLTAEFQPFQEVDVMAKVAGYVRSIRVDIGDRVREGELLAELEIPEMNDELSKAAALVEQTASEITAAEDELKRVESAHQIAHLSYQRLKEVAAREQGLIPQQELDESQSRDLVAEAQLAAARSKLQAQQSKFRAAKAEEARLRTLRNYVTITAPFAGTITKRYANVGSMIQAGISSQSQAMPVVRLSQISTLRLSLPVPESLVPSVRVGQPAEVRVKSLGRSFAGRVARCTYKVDPSTRTMIAEVDVPNPESVILPGMYAEVVLETKRHDNALVVPVEAIERSGASATAFVVDESGLIRVEPVQLGIEDPRRVEIVAGLRESDLVITGRRAGLKAGDKVVPKILSPEQ